MSIDKVRLTRAYLSRVAEPPAPALAAFVDEVGPVKAAELVRAGRVPEAVEGQTSARRGEDRAEQDLRRMAELGGRLVVPEDDEWPEWPFNALTLAAANGLKCGLAPLALWVRGKANVAELAERAVAVVGSRDASGYGQHIATEFGYGLAEKGIVVVSGAAYGIDGCAHRGALAAEGSTIAVLACGVDVPYPAGHANLIARIPERGLVVSEYPPAHTPARHRFLTRNRLIAALGDGTVVVEAGRRSGAKLSLIHIVYKRQAIAVSTVAEVVESTGRIGADLVESTRQSSTAIGPPNGDAVRVHEALGLTTGHSAEVIAVESGVALSTVRALLPEFEMAGLAERVDTGWKRSHVTAGCGDA